MSWIADVLDRGRAGPAGRHWPGPSVLPPRRRVRIEIPSVEGPKVLEAVLCAARTEGITVNRVSQGSGAVLMRAVELRDMAQAGLEAGVEVCLFVGPRERYGVGAHARAGRCCTGRRSCRHRRGCDYDFLRPETAEQLSFVEPVIGRS
jgi:hypothetical protein